MTDSIIISEILYEGKAEQGVELDYVLPDYYPEIFRILGCTLTPQLQSCNAADGKLWLSGCVDIRVSYLAENSRNINCVEQKYSFSKTVELGRDIPAEGVSVKVKMRADYCNCRAISGRRLDLRGAVSASVRIDSTSQCALPALPEGLQIRTEEINCMNGAMLCEKPFSLSEQIETGSAGISYILRSSAHAEISEVKRVSDKAVIKGVVTVNATYGVHNPEEQGCAKIERMTADIPMSQIIDLPDSCEGWKCTAEADIQSLTLTPSKDSGIVACDIGAVCRVSCHSMGAALLPTDAYSTKCECRCTVKSVKAVTDKHEFTKALAVRGAMKCDSPVAEVMDCWTELINTSLSPAEDGAVLIGEMCRRALVALSDGAPALMEQREAFKEKLPIDLNDGTTACFTLIPTDCDYSINSDKELEVTSRMALNVQLTDSMGISMVETATLLPDKPIVSDSRIALKICCADGTESCWDIAKRCNADINSVMSENDIENRDERLTGMILVPTN